MRLGKSTVLTVIMALSFLVVVFILLFHSESESHRTLNHQARLISARVGDGKTGPTWKNLNSETMGSTFNQRASSDQPDRSENVKQHCHHKDQAWQLDQMSAEKKKTLFHHLLVSDKYKVLYCYIPKVACSNWKRVIKVLNGKMTSVYQSLPGKNVHHSTNLTFLSDYSLPEIQKRLDTYYKFMFVRDPLSRILSAFRNKFYGTSEAQRHMGLKYGAEIVGKYRNSTQNLSLDRSNITLTEFVRFLVDSDIQEMNEHWRPMYNLCQPCFVNYTYIGSLENLQEDAARVLRDVGATDVVEFPKQQRYYRTATLEERTREFQKVPHFYMRQLISTYSLDYALFGYEPPEILPQY